jgi:hypothetical protein
MTTYAQEQITCAACGKSSQFHVLISTSSFGGPDLDLRPPPLERDTMASWVQDCPECHYCVPDISELHPAAAAGMSGADYQATLASHSPASAFQRWALLAEAADAPEAAATALLWCAWTADDAGDDAGATAFRIQAAERFERLAPEQDSAAATPGLRQAVTCDIWRRAGAWSRAEAQRRKGLNMGASGNVRAVLDFAANLIARRDRACYRTADVPGLV